MSFIAHGSLSDVNRLTTVVRCFGQCKEWQDMMTRQTNATSSFDLLRHTLDLLETLQPMLQSTANKRNIFILAKQTVNTIKSMIQGPHERNQKALLATTFVSTVNRLLSGVVYVSEAPVSLHRIDRTSRWRKASLVSLREPRDHLDSTEHAAPEVSARKQDVDEFMPDALIRSAGHQSREHFAGSTGPLRGSVEHRTVAQRPAMLVSRRRSSLHVLHL
jgi:hypothetical protein